MATETIDGTGCHATVTAVPGHGNGLHRPPGLPEPIHITLVRALTASWCKQISTNERDETLVTEECCEYEWYDDEDDETSLAECAGRAVEAERVADLSDVLANFADDLDTLRFLAIGEKAGLVVAKPVDRHPIAQLYARRVAQFAGVALAEDEEARRAYVAAREGCRWLVVEEARDTDVSAVAGGDVVLSRFTVGTRGANRRDATGVRRRIAHIVVLTIIVFSAGGCGVSQQSDDTNRERSTTDSIGQTGAVAPLLSSATGRPQGGVPVGGEDALEICPRARDICSVELAPIAELSDSSSRGLFGTQSFIQQDRKGRYFATTASFDQIAIFDSTGVLLTVLGERGREQGQFQLVTAPLPGPADTLFVFDNHLQKVVAVTPELRLGTETPLATFPVLFNDDGNSGSFLVAEQIRTPESAGFPIHVVARDGEVLRSFGTDVPQYRPDLRLWLSRNIGPASDGGVWAMAPGKYVLDKFDPGSGHRLKRTVVASDWFTEHPYPETNPWEHRPVPVLLNVWEDDIGVLWVLGRDGDVNWVPTTKPENTMVPFSVDQYDRFYDYVVDAINPVTGEVLGSLRLDRRHWSWAPSGMIVTRAETQRIGVTAFTIMRPVLTYAVGR